MNLKDVTLSGNKMQMLSYTFDHNTKHLFFASDFDCVAVVVETHDLGISPDLYIDIFQCTTYGIDIERMIADIQIATHRTIPEADICFINDMRPINRDQPNYRYKASEGHKMYEFASLYDDCLYHIAHDGRF